MFAILPKAVVNDLLVSWLTLPSVGKLDSALCSQGSRPKMLTYLQASSFGSKLSIDANCKSEDLFSWILKRNVKLQVVELTLNMAIICNEKLRRDVLSLVGKGLSKITIDNSTACAEQVDTTILDVAMHCTNLKECDISKYSDLSVTTLLARNPNLERITLHGCTSADTTGILHSISFLCPGIVSIDLRVSVAKHSCESFLSTMPTSLQSLCLRNCSHFTWENLLDILRNSNLHQLHVGELDNKLPQRRPVVEFVGMRCFRAEFYQVTENVVLALAQMMPRLSTVILLSRYGNQLPNGAKQILDHFPYLRQLVTVRQFEDKLKPLRALQPCPTLDDPNDILPVAPVAGSLLEVLYDPSAAVWVSSMSLPALTAIGTNDMYSLPVLPSHVKSFLWSTIVRAAEEKVICRLSGLEEIDITVTSEISSATMYRVALQNPKLRMLCVRQKVASHDKAPVLPVEGPWIFLTHCPLLHTLVYTATREGQKVDQAAAASGLLKKALCRSFPNVKNFTYSMVV